MAENAEQQTFEAFLERWLLRQQNLLEQLLTVSSTASDCADKMDHQQKTLTLIDQVLSHYQQYFEEKSRVANVNVFILFSPTWLSSYERAFLWITDYKPCLILQLVDGAVEGLTAEQKQRLESVRDETKRGEREVSAAMAGVQETVAGPSMLGLARWVGRVLNGEILELDTAIEVLKRAMVGVLERADELRVTTVRKVAEILNPPQTVQFLAAAAQFQLRVRRWGLERDSKSDPQSTQTGTTLSRAIE